MLKKLVLIIFSVILVISLITLIKLQSFYNNIHSATTTTPKPTLPPEKTVFNILLLGYGGAGHDGSYLTDTMMVAHIDIQKNKLTLISIPRDLWVKVPTKSGTDYHSKINALYQMSLFPKDLPDINTDAPLNEGMTNMAEYGIKEVTGLTIDNYAGIDFTGFKKIVDMLGGVDINVEKTFDDYEYPIDGKENDTCGKKDQDFQDAVNEATMDAALAFPCRYEHLHFDKGLQHMDGETALKYTRSRHSLQDGTDLGRAARQQRLLEAVKDKLFSFGGLTKSFGVMDEMQKYIKTDIDLNEIKKFSLEAKDRNEYTINHLVPQFGEQLKNSYSDYGGSILVSVDGIDQWDNIHQWISDSLAGITPTPLASTSATLKPTRVLPTEP